MAQTIEQQIENYLNALSDAIDKTMVVDVADLAKGAISDAAKTEVYDKYTPRFYSRRGPHLGGIMDEQTMITKYDGSNRLEKRLVISSEAEFQHLWGGHYPDENLSDVIERGDGRFYMGLAGPRPYHDTAKETLIKSGLLDNALEGGVERELHGRKF